MKMSSGEKFQNKRDLFNTAFFNGGPTTVHQGNVEEVFNQVKRAIDRSRSQGVIASGLCPMAILRNYQPNTLQMFYIKLDPQFGSGDPLANPEMISYANEIVRAMDPFVQKCVGKILSPDSLALFVETKGAVPGLDLELTFFTPSRRRLRILFHNNVIGSAMFNTEMERKEDGAVAFNNNIVIEKI
jgi:hypothetical protein